MIVAAADFATSDHVAVASGEAAQYGSGVILNAPPYLDRPNAVSYVIVARCSGRYSLSVEYAAAEPRPVQITVNGTTLFGQALNASTGGWLPVNQRWRRVGLVLFKRGENTMGVRRDHYFPHIRTFKLEPID